MGRPQNLIEILESRSQTCSAKAAFVWLEDGVQAGAISYSDLHRTAMAIAARLQSLGVGPNERALLLYPPGIDFACAFFGAIYAGVTPVPAVPPHSRRSVPHLLSIIQDSGPALILSNGQLRQRLDSLTQGESVASSCRVIETDAIALDEADGWRRPQLGVESLALLQYTSGSTSAPKGVKVSHRNVLHNLSVLDDLFQLRGEDVFVTWLPHYHDMGLIANRIWPVALGATTYLLAPAAAVRSPFSWLKAISDFRGVFSGAPNFLYQLCVERIAPEQVKELDLRSWSCAFNGAEPVRDSTLQAFVSKFSAAGFAQRALAPAYGMAEATLVATSIRKNEEPRTICCNREAYFRNVVKLTDAAAKEAHRVVSCGVASSPVPVAIRDTATHRKAAPLEIGEVCIGGGSISEGYFNSGTMTKVRFDDDADATAYLASGDLGFLDHEGHLYITGRIKDLIVMSGACFHPHDLELSVSSAHPELTADKCIAFSVDDGESEKIVIACEPGRRHLRAGDISDIVQEVTRAMLEEYGLDLHKLLLLPPGALPRTSSGKPRRSGTRAAFLAGELEPLHVWTAPPRAVPGQVVVAADRVFRDAEGIEDWLVGRLTAYLNVDPQEIDPEEHLACYGVDSTMGVQLIGDLSLLVGEEINPTLLWEHGTISGLSKEVSELLAAADADA